MLKLDFKFKPSRIYIGVMACLLLLSAGIITCLPVELALRGVGLVLVATYGFYILFRFGFLRSSDAVVGMRQERNGNWFMQLRSKEVPVEILGDTLVTEMITVLRYRSAKCRWPGSCIVLPDSMEPNVYRRLLLALHTS